MAFIYDLADTWNDAGTTFTAIKMNVTDTASASGSLLMDLQRNGVSKFKVRPGTVNVGCVITNDTALELRMDNSIGGRFGEVGGNAIIVDGIGIKIESTYIKGPAANVLEQRFSTNAQTFNLYNTYTDASNYERASFTQTATGLVLDSQYLGTGTEPDNILELKSGGASKFSVDKTGRIYLAGTNNFIERTGTAINTILFSTSNATRLAIAESTTEVAMAAAYSLSWGSVGATDLRLYRDAANTLAQRNGTNAQTFNLYNTYTDGSNYERGVMKWNSNVLEIGTEKAGTGTARSIEINIGTTRQATFQTDITFLRTYVGFGDVGNNAFTSLRSDVSGVLRLANGISTSAGGAFEMIEMTAPSAPSADRVRIYAEDDGAGKTRLMALFPTGAAQQIAIEP